MNGRGILKKPKREIESDGEDEKKNHLNHNSSKVAVVDDDDSDSVSTSSYEEQEEALVALIEHRTKEVELLKTRISYYESECKQAERKLNNSQDQLVKVRRKIRGKKWNDPSKMEGKKERRSRSPVNANSSQRQPQSKPQLLISNTSQKSSRLIVAESGPKASSSHYDSPMKSRGEKSHGTPSKSEDSKSDGVGAKRKLECIEHKELVSKVRSNSSPTMIQCYSSTHIPSQHKRKIRSLTLCPVIEKLFVTSALDGMIHLWQIQAKG